MGVLEQISSSSRNVLALALIWACMLSPGNASAHHFGGGSAGVGGSADMGPPKPDPKCESTANPISLFSGSEQLTEGDLEVEGLQPIRIVRRYDSRSTYDSPLGYGWAFTYDLRIFEYSDGSVMVRNACGELDRYVSSGASFVSPPGKQTQLTTRPDGGFQIRFFDGVRQVFDSSGLLTSILDENGNRLEFSYDSRGKLPLMGTSPAAIDPGIPMVVALVHRMVKVEERAADGNLTGRLVTFAYDTNGRLESIAAYDGRTVRYEHDQFQGSTRGNLTKVTGLEGVISTYGYGDTNDPHNATSIQVGVGSAAVLNTYDSSDRVMEQRRGQEITRFNYTQSPVEATEVRTVIVDENGQNPVETVAYYKFDTAGFTTEIVDPEGNVERRTLDAQKNIRVLEIYQNDGTVASPNLVLKAKFDFDYDTLGNSKSDQVQLADGEVLTETRTYDQGQPTSEERRSSRAGTRVVRTEYEYEAVDGYPARLRSVRRAVREGTATVWRINSFHYNANGQMDRITLPDGREVVQEYYPTNFGSSADPNDIGRRGLRKRRVLMIAGAEDPHLAKQYDYDASSRLAVLRNALGGEVRLAYDTRGRLLSSRNEAGEIGRFRYSGPDPKAGQSGLFLTEYETGITSAEPTGAVARKTFSPTGDLLSVETREVGEEFKIKFSGRYDGIGRLVIATDGVGVTLREKYDGLGRVIEIQGSNGARTTFDYDALGQLISGTEAAGSSVETKKALEYDAAGRIIRVTDSGVSGSAVTTYQYDVEGSIAKVVDPIGNELRFDYNELGNLIEIKRGQRPSIRYEYDLNDRLKRVTNGRQQVLEFEYEPWGPLREKRYLAVGGSTVERRVTTTYDLLGLPVDVNDTAVPGGKLYTVGHDAAGREMSRIVHYIPGGPRVVRQEYDRFGNRKALEIVDGSETLRQTYTNRALGPLREAMLPGGQFMTVKYLDNDAIARIMRSNGFDTALTYKSDGSVESITVGSATAALARFVYSRDPLKRVGSLEENLPSGSKTTAFDYDAFRHLKQAGAGAGAESFVLDPVGNQISAGYSYGPDSQILTSPGRQYGSDDDGNVSSIAGDAGGQSTLSFDRENQLESYTRVGATVSYTYDSEGRRIRKTSPGSDTWFLWDEDRLLAEFDGSGSRQTRYAYLGDSVPVQLARRSGGVEQIYDVHSDDRGAPRLVTNRAGSVVWSANYDARGKATVDPSSTIALNIRLPGQYFDAESSLHYNRFRYYAPSLGRYLSLDPIGLSGGLNPYVYSEGDPINGIDPLGLRRCAPKQLCKSILRTLYNIRDKIIEKTAAYRPEPGGDGTGGFKINPGGRLTGPDSITKPGSHYIELLKLSRDGLRGLAEYYKDCINCDRKPNDPPPPSPPGDLKELCKRPIQPPAVPNQKIKDQIDDKLKDDGFNPLPIGVLAALAAAGKALADMAGSIPVPSPAMIMVIPDPNNMLRDVNRSPGGEQSMNERRNRDPSGLPASRCNEIPALVAVPPRAWRVALQRSEAAACA